MLGKGADPTYCIEVLCCGEQASTYRFGRTEGDVTSQDESAILPARRSTNSALWTMVLVVALIAAIAYALFVLDAGGTLRVRTTPPGVNVVIDGSTVGVTSDSVLVLEVARGTVKLGLHKQGFERVQSEETIRRGEVIEVEQVMQRFEMSFIGGGAFEMGDRNGAFSEKPVHTVELDPYYLDRTEVTVGAFRGYDPGYRSVQDDRQPVTDISWTEAEAYCRSVGKRLPSEAEWERACRGARGAQYGYGDRYDIAAGRSGQSLGAGPVAVGSYATGHGGLLDLTGNVWEWCSDWYGRDYYKTSPRRNPTGPATGDRRAIRGGAWFSNAAFSKCTHRPGNILSKRDPSIGFRCAQDLN